MGETSDELRQEIESKREDASQKIEQIEQKVTGAADQVKDQVTQTKDQVMQTFDVRQQVEERPLVAVGAAFLGGVLLGNLLGGDDEDGRDRYESRREGSFDTVQYRGRGRGRGRRMDGGRGGIKASVRKAAKTSGLEETIGGMTAGFMATLADRMKRYTDEAFPGIAEKMQRAAGSSRSSAGSATGSMPTGTVNYSRSGEVGGATANG